jgi:hypothetical protein
MVRARFRSWLWIYAQLQIEIVRTFFVGED